MATQATSGADAREAASRARTKAKEAVQHTKDQIKDIGATAAEDLKEAGAQAAQKLGDTADQKKQTIVSSLDTLADKLGETREGLDSEWVSGLANQAQSSLRSVARYLEGTKPQNFMKDMATVVRERPALVIGGALLLGFALARAARVAAAELSDQDHDMMGDVGSGYRESGNTFSASAYAGSDGSDSAQLMDNELGDDARESEHVGN